MGLRAFLLKINISESILTPSPKGCTFSVIAYMKDKKEVAKSLIWIPHDHQKFVGQTTIVPLKSFDTGLLRLQLYVEQSQQKEDLQSKEQNYTQEIYKNQEKYDSSFENSEKSKF